MKIHVYVDGFNLYYGAVKGTPYRWLDPRSLVQKLVKRHHHLIKIKYFTARVSGMPGNENAPARQDAYLRALQSIPGFEPSWPLTA